MQISAFFRNSLPQLGVSPAVSRQAEKPIMVSADVRDVTTLITIAVNRKRTALSLMIVICVQRSASVSLASRNIAS